MTSRKKEIVVLQIGNEDWSELYSIPERMEWVHLSQDDIPSFLKSYQAQKEAYLAEQQLVKENAMLSPETFKTKKPTTYQALLLTDKEYPESITEFGELFEPYEVFYGQEPQTEGMALFLRHKMAQRLDLTKPELLIQTFNKALFRGQYGAKLQASQVQISSGFSGNISLLANRYMVLDGDFGADFKQIAYWPQTLSFDAESAQDFFWDHLCSPGVETKLVVRLIQDGSVDHVIKEWSFALNGSQEQCHLNFDGKGYLSVSLWAKGSGKLHIGSCHYRYSRCGLGEFVLGGERFVDEAQDEFMYYFHPQDFKPPLCVYFSGWRAAEGFEGYAMMKAMKTPFMLICDPRLLGGSFYMGGEAFERRISEVIQEKLDFLGFDSSQLILSGLSMGTYGAAYHGSRLSPHTIIIGKPVFSLGEVALKEKIIRPGGFRTSLDLLKWFGNGEMTESAAMELDHRFWKVFRQADYSQTSFIVCYMQDEDYDSTAFEKILEHSHSTSKRVIVKGIPGRHNDNFGAQLKWFITQYYKVLKEDFGREY